MASFAGTNLSTWGIFDLGGRFRKPGLSRQISEQTAPGVNGSFLLIGGKKPQSFAAPLRMRGVSPDSYNAAQALLLSHHNDINDLIGTTATFEDDDNVSYEDCSLLDADPKTGTTYHREGSNYVVSIDILLMFRRTLT